MDDLDALPERYSTILCDVWGVIHDGARLYPGVKARLERWRDEGREVIVITNAPRPADRVHRQLKGFGLTSDLWTAITSSGQAGIDALTHPRRAVGFCGSEYDFEDMAAHGVLFATAQQPHDEICMTGLDEHRSSVEEYEADLAAWRARDMLVHCLNPDRVVEHRGHLIVCAGALADRYEEIGGRVRWYGKPEAPIFDHALELAGDPPRSDVVMIGDAQATDMLGAKNAGIDGILVRAGVSGRGDIEWGAEFGDWRPVMTVPGL